MSQKERRDSVWKIDDMAEKENMDNNNPNIVETDDQQQSQTVEQQAQKIGTRRQSERVLQKRLASSNDKNIPSESNDDPAKKREKWNIQRQKKQSSRPHVQILSYMLMI